MRITDGSAKIVAAAASQICDGAPAVSGPRQPEK